MIEFKATCGHTIRTKDEDAGGRVRCSYCGKEADVPGTHGDDLDFLLSDVEQSVEAGEVRRHATKRRRRWFRRRARKTTDSDPFGVVLRMCYWALLFVILYVVAVRYVVPFIKEGGLPRHVTGTAPPVQQPTTGRAVRDRPAAEPRSNRPQPTVRRLGLINRPTGPGLYLVSAPPGAAAYCIAESDAPPEGSLREVPGISRTRGGHGPIKLGTKAREGTFMVDVVMSCADPRLMDSTLPYYKDYVDFRRSLVEASPTARIRLMERYFLPDEASEVFVESTEDELYLVRRYRFVRMRKDEAKIIRALFLPRITVPGQTSISLSELLTYYIPAKKNYLFDDNYVRKELQDIYDVPDSDRLFLVQALERLGVIPYVTPDGRTRLFKIGVDNGRITARILTDGAP